MLTHVDLYTQYWEAYCDCPWQKQLFTRKECDEYFDAIIKNNHLLRVFNGTELVGFLEFSYHSGICWIDGFYIFPKYRDGEAFKMLRKMLLDKCPGARVFVGERWKDNMEQPHIFITRSQNGEAIH